MWMRKGATSLLPLCFSSKCSRLNQGACGLRLLKHFSNESQKPDYGGAFTRESSPFITFVLGGPGSGKGTQCMKIVENFGFTHLSAGDLLRREMSSNSEYGPMILNTIKDGKIVPSEVTVRLLQKAIESSDNDKFLIDGFPRTEENRLTYEKIIGMEPNIVLFFDCPEEEMVRRVLNRREGRIDDNEDTVKERLKVFLGLTLPVVDYYSKKGKLCKIDATGTTDEIFARVHPVFASDEKKFGSSWRNNYGREIPLSP